jgi:FkbM family methyltransferase
MHRYSRTKTGEIVLLQLKKTLLFACIFNSYALANMPRGGFKPFISSYFVETGTAESWTVDRILGAGFKFIHSIEIDPKLAEIAMKKYKNNPNVRIWHGDSGSILYDVIADINEPITFWLDTSSRQYNLNGENTPILRELDAIRRHHIKNHIIIIDDMHCTGTLLFDFITKESLIAKIKEINPHYVIRYMPGGDDGEYPNNIMVAQVPSHRCPYLDSNIISKIDKNEVQSIIEIGAYDGLDALSLHDYYQCPVVSFECAPESIKKCRTLITQEQSIKLVEKAAWDVTQEIDFNYCPNHPSASSCYFFDYQTMANRDRTTMPHMVKQYPMKPIKVQAIRLDEWLRGVEIYQVDLICMSTQGSIMPVLKGLGSHLKNVKYIVTQVMYQRIYEGEALFPEVKAFMEDNGFTVFNEDTNGFFNMVIFVRNDLCE